MVFSRGQVFLCSNGTWRKITGINRWKNEVYYTSNSKYENSPVYTTQNMSMQFWCTYHDVRLVDSIEMANLCARLPELTEAAHSKGLRFAERQIGIALS